MRTKSRRFLAWVLALTFVLASTAFAARPGNRIARYLADFVILKEGKLVPYDSLQLFESPYKVLYYGAGWCPDCRKFSPALVEAYNRQPAKGRRFELLYVSRDKTEAGMIKFMSTDQMPWPAFPFGKLEKAKDLKRLYSGHGIPCLTVLNAKGEVVLQSKTDQDGKDVLAEFENLLAKSRE
jgi:nucleoredoxin